MQMPRKTVPYCCSLTISQTLHWPRSAELFASGTATNWAKQISWCVLVYNCLYSSAPRYLQEVIQPVAEVTSRRRLRSSSSSALLVPVTRRTTLGDRAFAVAGPRAWNTVPDFITDYSSSRTFKQYLKTYLFSLSLWARNNTLFYDCVKRSSSSLFFFWYSAVVAGQ